MQDTAIDMAKDTNVSNVHFYLGLQMVTVNCFLHEVPLIIRFFFCVRGGLPLTDLHFQNL